LTNTPGAPITLDGERYTNTAFSVAIPRGWRVITSPADAPPAVTFAAPDGCTVIHLSTIPADPPVAPNCDQAVEPFTQTLSLGADTLTLVGSAPADADASLRAAADLITESLRRPE